MKKRLTLVIIEAVKRIIKSNRYKDPDKTNKVHLVFKKLKELQKKMTAASNFTLMSPQTSEFIFEGVLNLIGKKSL